MPRWRKALLGLATLLWLSGCSSALGQARMATKSGESSRELNAPLAVGASIQPELKTNLAGSATPTLLLVSARPEVIASAQGRLVARSPGVAAILITTQEGVVVDFYHLWVEKPTRVVLHRTDGQGKDLGEVVEGLDLLVGESVYLTPMVYFNAQQLTGTVEAEWSATAPIVDFLRPGIAGSRRMVARSPGEATLRLAVAGTDLKVPIRVLEGPAFRPMSRAAGSPGGSR